MYTLFKDVEKDRFVIKDQGGRVIASRDYLDSQWFSLDTVSAQVHRDLQRLVRLANLGLEQLEQAPRKIAELTRIIEDDKTNMAPCTCQDRPDLRDSYEDWHCPRHGMVK